MDDPGRHYRPDLVIDAILAGLAAGQAARIKAQQDAEDTRRKQEEQYQAELKKFRDRDCIEGECVEIRRSDKLLTQQ